MTVQQRIAADPENSVWVSANAGSGKTRVLTDRVLRLLLEGALPYRILCLTYTKAAAAEMSLRIQAQLSQWVTANDEELKLILRNLLGALPNDELMQRARRLFARVSDAPEGVRIQTIHSLCQTLLKRFAIEAGVSPHFRLMEEQQTRALLEDAKERLFLASRNIEDSNPLVQAVRNLASTIAESTFNELIREIITQRSAMEGVVSKGLEYFRQQITAYLNIEFPLSSEKTLIIKYFSYEKQELEQLRMFVLLASASDKATDQRLAITLESWLLQQSNPDEAMVEQWLDRMLTKNNPRELKSLFTNTIRTKMPEADEVMRKEIERAYAFWQERAALRMAKMSEDAWHIASALITLYENIKHKKGMLDYEDLIVSASQLLTKPGIAPWVLYKLDGGIEHLLVDEAQDTSPIQWKLIQALASEFFTGQSAVTAHRTLFVVGDEKQSIYSFQGAEPAAFAEMKHYFAKKIQAANKRYQPVSLVLSFRSAAAILRVVDAVFARPEASNGVLFTEHEVIHQASRTAPGRVELWPLLGVEETEEREAWTIPDKQVIPQLPERMLAEKIASTIADWLKCKRILTGHKRPVNAGDIIILVRRRNRFFDFLIQTLKAYNIPLAGADRLELGQHIAIQDMLALAQFLLLPEDDLNLACLLKSPLFQFTEEQIYTLCQPRKSSLWQELRQYQEGIFNETASILESWLAKVDYLPPFEMFSHILESKGGRKAFVARMGEEVNDPLNEFLALSLQYENLQQPSMQGFLHWFENSETEIKRDLEQAKQEVRVLTVHGAKGLEAPIVFLPDTTTLPDNPERLLWPEDKRFFLWSYAAQEDCLPAKKLKAMRYDKAMSEYRRLLYVAMTRAADELYICGWKNARTLPENCWYVLVKEGMRSVITAKKEQILPGRGVAEIWVCEDSDIAKQDLAAVDRESFGIKEERNHYPATEMPQWLREPAPEEPLLSRPLTPSRPEGQEPSAVSLTATNKSLQRGKVIHSLLEILPELPESHWQEAGRILLNKSMPELAAENTAIKLLEEVFAVLRHSEFGAVFGPGSQAEVPITATIMQNGVPRVLAGQIDRLVITEDYVMVLDYKTTPNIPEDSSKVPLYYRNQLNSYATALAQIYPEKQVKTAILWTASPLLMPVPLAQQAA